MPRCEQCSKLASLETGADVEVSDLELSGSTISARFRIHNDCADCNTELKAAEFEVEYELNLEHQHQVDEDEDGNPTEPEWEPVVEVERTERHHPPRSKRYATFYGVGGLLSAKCSCGFETPEVAFSDEVKASHMDDA